MTGPETESPTAQGLVPPRPNLGPEPWDEPPGRASTVGLGLLAMAVLSLAAWRWRKSRRGKPDRPGPGADLAEAHAPDPSPRSRLIAATEAVRSALVASRGAAWGSKTTEELATERWIVERLGPERAGRLVELFRLGDRAKFADEAPEEVDEWEARAGQLLVALAAEAAPRPNGR